MLRSTVVAPVLVTPAPARIENAEVVPSGGTSAAAKALLAIGPATSRPATAVLDRMRRRFLRTRTGLFGDDVTEDPLLVKRGAPREVGGGVKVVGRFGGRYLGQNRRFSSHSRR